MSIPYIDPADLGNPNQFKLFASNMQTFKELLVNQEYYQAVQLGTQLQEDLDSNPGWNKQFSIKKELTEACIFLKIEDAKRYLKDLESAKKTKDVPAVEKLLTQLKEIQAFLNKEHYFIEDFKKPIAKGEKWLAKQFKEEKKSHPKSNEVSPPPISPQTNDPKTDPSDIPVDHSEDTIIITKENPIEAEEILVPVTQKFDIPDSFFEETAADSNHNLSKAKEDISLEINPDFIPTIKKELIQNLPQFTIHESQQSKNTLFKYFQYYGVYFNEISHICTLLLIQPVSLKGKLILKSKIKYDPLTTVSESLIEKEIQQQILNPYLNYKQLYQFLEDNELDAIGPMLEAELIRKYRKISVIQTANAFSIDFKGVRFALDLRAYFILNGDLEYDGNAKMPGIPSIKLHFIPNSVRNEWYLSLPTQPSIEDQPQPPINLVKTLYFEKLVNTTRILVFCCGIAQILAYFINSIDLFYISLISVGVIGFTYSILQKILLKKKQSQIMEPPAGLISPSVIALAKNIDKTLKIKNNQSIVKSKDSIKIEFANQRIMDFLN